jgi:TRAP-type C4-dicarboxylate transport system substrate-binding protein
MIESVQLGTLDLVNTSSGPLGNFVPEVKIFDIPFLFRDYDHARKVLDGKIGQDILKKFESKGLVGLTWGENGFRHMTNNKQEIRTPADAAGLKMRTMENKVHMDGYKAFGILPTPMAFTELFTALQQGTWTVRRIRFRSSSRQSSARCRSSCPSPAMSIRRLRSSPIRACSTS